MCKKRVKAQILNNDLKKQNKKEESKLKPSGSSSLLRSGGVTAQRELNCSFVDPSQVSVGNIWWQSQYFPKSINFMALRHDTLAWLSRCFFFVWRDKRFQWVNMRAELRDRRWRRVAQSENENIIWEIKKVAQKYLFLLFLWPFDDIF